MSNFQELVKEFQVTSGQKVSDVPYIMTKEESDFRKSLLDEEIQELRQSIKDNNRVEILDALCDIKYVNDGTANMIGTVQDDDFQENHYDTIGDIDAAIEVMSILSESNVLNINDHVYFLASMFGFSLEVFKEALIRVHLSNMSKFCKTIDEARKTVGYYQSRFIPANFEKVGDRYVVYRTLDGKVLKSIDYKPVKLHDLVL